LFAKYNCNYQVKEDEMGRACSTNRGEGECMSDFGGKAGRCKRPLGRPRDRWEDIRMDFRDRMGWYGLD
jgi:hypothetical protein